MIHEIGHHATHATRYGLLVEWLSWPWRAVYRASTRLGREMPYAEVGTLLMAPAFVIAIVRTAQLHAPPEQLVPVLALLVTLSVGIFAAPVADAALARASEYAADRYAAARGAGPDLAAALARDRPLPVQRAARPAPTHPPSNPLTAGPAGRRASRYGKTGTGVTLADAPGASACAPDR